MTIRSARELTVPIALAVLGACLALGSMLMQWFAVDTTLIGGWMERLTPEQLEAAMRLGRSEAMKPSAGYLALAAPSVAAQVAGGVLALTAAVGAMREAVSRAQFRLALAVAGGLLCLQPVWAMTHLPGRQLEQLIGGSVLKASTGLSVALAGALLVLGAAVTAHFAANADRLGIRPDRVE